MKLGVGEQSIKIILAKSFQILLLQHKTGGLFRHFNSGRSAAW
jgi:hypothetical protein